jgi:ornithine carbamoyltransferase
MVKHIGSMLDVTKEDVDKYYAKTKELKDGLKRGQRPPLLRQKTLATVWERPSLRTRVSFESGMAQLGGHMLMLKAYPKEAADIIFGEDVRDQASVLSSMCDIVAARVYAHKTIDGLCKYSTVPVLNMMCDEAHPMQILTDMYTILENKGKLKGLKIAYMGDGMGNTAQDMAVGATMMGINFTLGCPDYDKAKGQIPESLGYPTPKYWDVAKEHAKKTGAELKIEHDPVAAVKGADAIYTDTWIAMDKPEEKAAQDAIKSVFMPFQVNATLIKHAKPDAILMHCLPAYKGNEITADMFDHPNCRIYQQAENRMHVQKGIMVTLIA